MSLKDIMATQQQIQAEQKAIRDDLMSLQRKIDSTLKGDIQRLIHRLDATDERIGKLTGGNGFGSLGGGDAPGRQAPAACRGIRSPQMETRDLQPMSRTTQPMSRPVTATAPQSLAAAAPPRALGAQRSVTVGGRLKRKTEDELQQVKAAIASVVKQGKKSNTWEEPPECKAAPAALDRVETMLKSALERCKEFQRNQSNPIQGAQALFQRLDKNHSGKVDKQELCNLTRLIEFQADQKSIENLFDRYDVDHSGVLTIEEFARSLFKMDGDAEFKAKSAIARMREVLAMRAGGFESVQAMGSQFRIIDRDRTGELSKEEFNIALDILFAAYNCKFTQAERNSLFTLFDSDKAGTVSYDEFVRGIRGDMSDFRLDWVKQAFAILDSDGSGVVDIQDIAKNYDVTQNPAVQSGKVSPEDAEREFLKKYDTNSDGKVTLEEFVESYQWISATITSDDYFELMMRNAWHITGGEGWCENTSNLRVLVKHFNAEDEVVELKHDMGLPREPDAMYQEVVKRLQQQGVKDVKKVEFFG